MSHSLNQFICIGRMTRDPEVKPTSDPDKSVVKFGVAVDRRGGKDKEQKTDFFNVTAFGKNGKFVGDYGQKGRLVVVTGRMEINTVESPDGGKRTFADVVSERVDFLDSPKDFPAAGSGEQTPDDFAS